MAYGPDSGVMNNEAEQDKLLEDTLRVVKTQAFEMKRCLDRKEIMDGLRFANVMLAELRATNLSPKHYYRLCELFDVFVFIPGISDIDVTNELQHFLSYLEEEYLNTEGEGKKVAELYELVQFAGNIIPRLYLMITVGIAYIKSKEAPRKDILRDLVSFRTPLTNNPEFSVGHVPRSATSTERSVPPQLSPAVHKGAIAGRAASNGRESVGRR